MDARNLFTRLRELNTESISLELQQLQDLVVKHYDPELPAKSLIETYTMLSSIDNLIRDLALLASQIEGDQDLHESKSS
jgi:hypothetical protein